MSTPLAADLDRVLEQSADLWEGLRGARLFVTGGTGFFGCWMLETLLWANERCRLGASAVVLTRDAGAFRRKAPHLAASPALTLHDGDVRTFTGIDGDFSHVIHAGADTQPARDRGDRLRVFDSIVTGTRRVLDIAGRGTGTRFLLASSGAVYGRQPVEIPRLPEDFPGAPNPMSPASSGAEAKRAAEALCAVYADAHLQPLIARCFAFTGPYLPLEMHYAIGNFIADGLRGGPIRVLGDGTPMRSYMYASDLAVWLWTILLRGEPLHPYNVGSESAMSIADVAHAVASRFERCEVRIEGTPRPGAAADRYVPSTARARRELGLSPTVDFDDALTRTVEWYRARGTSTHAAN